MNLQDIELISETYQQDILNEGMWDRMKAGVAGAVENVKSKVNNIKSNITTSHQNAQDTKTANKQKEALLQSYKNLKAAGVKDDKVFNSIKNQIRTNQQTNQQAINDRNTKLQQQKEQNAKSAKNAKLNSLMQSHTKKVKAALNNMLTDMKKMGFNVADLEAKANNMLQSALSYIQKRVN